MGEQCGHHAARVEVANAVPRPGCSGATRFAIANNAPPTGSAVHRGQAGPGSAAQDLRSRAVRGPASVPRSPSDGELPRRVLPAQRAPDPTTRVCRAASMSSLPRAARGPGDRLIDGRHLVPPTQQPPARPASAAPIIGPQALRDDSTTPTPRRACCRSCSGRWCWTKSRTPSSPPRRRRPTGR